jgi:cytoskeletal protein CcmA (bactofilin family)
VGFKDDFVEALRSVKKDFFKEHDYPEHERQAVAEGRGASAVHARESASSYSPPEKANTENQGYDSYRQAGYSGEKTQDESGKTNEPARSYGSYSENSRPSSEYKSEVVPVETQGYKNGDSDRRTFVDYSDSGIYDEEQTIISKNTVIRGVLQTNDSVRLLGQIMGDIECKSNVVVAGKVRGNTAASNAYIFDAQVDGDVRCDDAVTVSSDAWVLGNIRAQQAEIDGKVKGNMEIRHMLSVGASSSILGDISTDELEIKRGAFVNGQIMMYSPARDVLDRFDSFED